MWGYGTLPYYHTPATIEVIDNMIFEDRKRKYSNALIVKIIVILQIYGISFRPSGNFFNNPRNIMEALEIRELPNVLRNTFKEDKDDW
jgi:hypothetical protein